MRTRRLLRTLVVTGAVVAAVVALPPVAHAATVLSPQAPLLSSATSANYSVTTTLPYWTAVAVRPAPGVDYDLRLYDGSTGALLSSSVWGGSATDVIAINSNFRPLGSYLANVYRYSGSGIYSVMFFQDRAVMPVPTDPVGSTATAIGINFDWTVSATQIYLRQNQGFRVHHGSDVGVFLAGSTPGVPSTYLRNRSALANAYVIADNVPSPGGGLCRTFLAPAEGWYSMILVWNTPWEAPPPYVGGHAVFPQRYDPALGDKLTDCPFPNVP